MLQAWLVMDAVKVSNAVTDSCFISIDLLPSVVRRIVSVCSDVFKLSKLVTSFQQIIDNLFLPLFEVSVDPSSHPELHLFLQYVSILFKNYCFVLGSSLFIQLF